MIVDMNQPAHTGIGYFTAEEQRHLEAFLKLGIKERHIYRVTKEVQDGDKKKKVDQSLVVRRIDYPYGIIIPNKTSYIGFTKDGMHRYYHTPNAGNTDTRTVAVYLEDPGSESGEWIKMESPDFMAWLGDKYTSEPEVIGALPPAPIAAISAEAQFEAERRGLVQRNGRWEKK